MVSAPDFRAAEATAGGVLVASPHDLSIERRFLRLTRQANAGYGSHLCTSKFMFGTIRKHSKSLWWIIIAAIIVTFVYWGAQGTRGDKSRGGYNYGSIGGRAISEREYHNAAQEARLAFFFSSGGEWPEVAGKKFGYDEQRDAYQRIFLARKMEDLGIYISDDLAARMAGDRIRRISRGQPMSLDDFAKKVLASGGATVADFQRLTAHEMGVQQLITVAGIGGDLLPPQEIQALYARDNTEISAQVVFFSLSNHLKTATAPPEKLAEFYTNYMAEYRIPERVQVTYVKFPFTDYTNQFNQFMLGLTNLAEIIEANYQRLGTNYFSEAKSPAEAKAKVREKILMDESAKLAGSNANVFATGLYNVTSNSPTTTTLASFAKEGGLTAKVSQPLSGQEPSSEFDVNANVMQAVFALTPQDPVTEPVIGNDAAYVFGLARRLPSENPPFESVRERVARDYQFAEAAVAARNEGSAFQVAATNGLIAGKTFAAICDEAKQTPVSPAPFSRSTRKLEDIEKHVELNRFKQAAFSTQPGNVSIFVPTGDGGFVVHVRSRLPLNETKMRADLPGFTKAAQQALHNDAFQEWFQREATVGLRDTPLMRQPQQQMSGTRK